MPTTTPFNNLITFSRGSNATVTGSNGLIQWAPNNLLTFSEQFDNAAWGKTGLGTGSAPVVTPNVVVAPDGTTTADLVAFNRGAGNAIGDRSTLSQLPTILNGYAYAATIYVKAATAGDVGKQLAYRGVAGVGYQVITLTADWVRITTVETSTGTAGNFELASRGTVSADNQVSAHVWGAQLELGSTATTYNSTTVKNLLGFSEAFDNAAWTKNSASIVTGAAANPINNLFNAQKLMEDTSTGTHRVFGAVTTAAQPYVFSAYIKPAGRSWVYLRLDRSGGSTAQAWFDVTNGVVGTIQTGLTANMQSVGNGWYRCFIAIDAAAAGACNPLIGLTSANGTSSYTGDGNSGVYIYGAQLSDSASLDQYVPTPGAAPSSTAFYGPRFDFDPVTRAPRGILIEEQRTNLLLRSDDFGNAYWSLSGGATIAANAATSPDGTTNADKLQEATATAAFSCAVVPTMAASTTHTFSCYMKAAERTFGVMNIFTGVASCWTWFNLSNGTVGTLGAGATATITAVRDGWYRCTLTIATAATGTPNVAIWPANANGNLSYAGTAGFGIFLYGAQLEAGAFATSYIPTVASTVTRSADVATITGQNFAQWYRQPEGSYVASFSTLWTGAAVASYGVLGMDSSSTKRVIQLQAGVSQPSVRDALTTLVTANSITTGVNTVASAYNPATKAIVLAGGAVASDAVDAAYSVSSSLNVGAFGTNPLNGHIRNIRFIPARAADFQLQALST